MNLSGEDPAAAQTFRVLTGAGEQVVGTFPSRGLLGRMHRPPESKTYAVNLF